MAANPIPFPSRSLLDQARHSPLKSLDLREVRVGQVIVVFFGTVPVESSLTFVVTAPARRGGGSFGYARVRLDALDPHSPFVDQLRCNGVRRIGSQHGAILGMRLGVELQKHRIVTGRPLRWSLYLTGKGEQFFEVSTAVSEWRLFSC